ncbi:MAG: TraR/DksA family transcriptional regulator [Myxococcales bacterium]|nr:TraR/DksA family transcriptional regulator [Myxococcales bacterium]MCB9750568.1 TraR/DksA family transcriptional regulator [Myxococcales bacterium]
MDHLSEQQVSALREQLERERAELLERAERLMGEEAGVELDTGDRQDVAAAEAARALELRLAGHELSRLRELEAALARVEDGTYGVCEDTDEAISFARLRLQPTARYTVAALELRERAAGKRARLPKGEDEVY